MKRRAPVTLIVLGLIVAVGFLHLVGVLRPVENDIRWAFEPIASVFGFVGVSIGRQTEPKENISALKTHVRDLEARLSTVSVDYVRLKALEEENHSLKELSSFLKTSGYDHVGARIIARSSDPQTATILIDRGASDGLEVGMAVISGDGIFVGKISSLNQNVSTVLLVSDRRSRIAAARAGDKKLFGIVQGEGNGVARLTLVPQADALAKNDIIITAGTEDKIPKNLAIGMVDDIQGHRTDPFKTATIEPLARPNSLNLVAVLRPDVLRPLKGNTSSL